MEPLRIETERRARSDRRKFSYAAYSPERRSGIDRRSSRLQQKNRLRRVV